MILSYVGKKREHFIFRMRMCAKIYLFLCFWGEMERFVRNPKFLPFSVKKSFKAVSFKKAIWKVLSILWINPILFWNTLPPKSGWKNTWGLKWVISQFLAKQFLSIQNEKEGRPLIFYCTFWPISWWFWGIWDLLNKQKYAHLHANCVSRC